MLKQKVENNPVIFFLGTLLVGFLSGITTYEAVLEIAKLEIIARHEASELKRARTALSKEIKILTARNTALDQSLTELQTAQESSPFAAGICPLGNQIALFSGYGEDDKRGMALMKLLNNEGCTANGVYASQNTLPASELRYFHKSDLETVKAIQKRIVTEKRVQLQLTFIEGYASQVDEGYFEIWLK